MQAEQAPQSPAQPDTRLGALERDLNVSEELLRAELDRKARGEPHRVGAPTKAAPEPEAHPVPLAPVSAEPPAGVMAERRSSIGAPCDLACRALVSMRRAAEGICSITGEPDPRCADARRRVALGEREVAGAGCVCRSR